MEEGTFPSSSSGGSPKPQNPWETPPTVFPAQPTPEQAPLPTLNQHKLDPPVVKINNNSGSGSGGSDEPHKVLTKKIIKLGIGLFVVLTVIFVSIAVIAPKVMKQEVKDVSLTYWGLYEDEATMKPIIADFETENPHIKVTYVKQDPTDYRERLNVRIANGNGPDVFRFHNTWYPMLSGDLLPLPKETIEKSEFESNYYNTVKTDLIKNGTIYGIPLMTDTLSLYVNKALFDQASKEIGQEIPIPKTWQEFIDASTSITKRNESGAIEIAGAGIGTYDNVEHAPDIISLLLAQNGVDLNDPFGYKDKISDAFRFYTTFTLNENNVWDATQDSTKLAFSQGKLAMYFGYSWDYFEIKAQNPSLQIEVVPVPQLVTDAPVNIASYWAEGVSSRSTHPKESLTFIKYLARQNVQEKLYAQEAKARAFGEPYSYVSLASKLVGSPAFVFADQSNTAVSTFFVEGTGDGGLNTKLNDLLKTSINGILLNDTEESAVDSLLQGYSQVISEYSEKQNQE